MAATGWSIVNIVANAFRSDPHGIALIHIHGCVMVQKTIYLVAVAAASHPKQPNDDFWDFGSRERERERGTHMKRNWPLKTRNTLQIWHVAPGAASTGTALYMYMPYAAYMVCIYTFILVYINIYHSTAMYHHLMLGKLCPFIYMSWS